MITVIFVIVALTFLAVMYMVVVVSHISGDMMDRIFEEEEWKMNENTTSNQQSRAEDEKGA